MCCLDRQVILIAIFCIKMVLFHRWTYEHLQTKYCDNLVEIFTKSTMLHISYVLNTLVRKVCKFQGESLSSLWLITCWKHHIALFSLYEFSLWVSHIKFLMRQYRHKTMSYHLFLPKRFLVDDIGTYDTLYSFLYVSFSYWGFSYKVFDEAMST